CPETSATGEKVVRWQQEGKHAPQLKSPIASGQSGSVTSRRAGKLWCRLFARSLRSNLRVTTNQLPTKWERFWPGRLRPSEDARGCTRQKCLATICRSISQVMKNLNQCCCSDISIPSIRSVRSRKCLVAWKAIDYTGRASST